MPSGSGWSICTPRVRIALTLLQQSSPGEKSFNTHTPLLRLANITARWLMLLSPGTWISAAISGARFTLNSVGIAFSRTFVKFGSGRGRNVKVQPAVGSAALGVREEFFEIGVAARFQQAEHFAQS